MSASLPFRRREVAVVVVALATLLAWSARVEPAWALVPSGLSALATKCRTFTSVKAVYHYARDDSEEEIEDDFSTALIEARPSWLTIDYWTGPRRFAFAAGQLTEDTQRWSEPRPKGGTFADAVALGWSVCRGGFQGATWTVRRPEQDGYSRPLSDLAWYKGTASAPWAQGLAVYLGIVDGEAKVDQVLWKRADLPGWGWGRVMYLEWNGIVPQQLDRNVPEEDLDIPKGLFGPPPDP
jgi:hypothetical protein